MSYPYPYQPPGLSSPGLDNFGKPMDPAVPAPALAYNNTGPRQSAMISLWREQMVALFAGGVTLTLGVLVLAAYLGTGPLHSAFIPQAALSGKIVNVSNIGALIAGLATAMSYLARHVSRGLSRAWLRRRAIKGEGPSIKQWRTISAGVSIRDVRRTPFIAAGITLIFTLAMSINGPALAGAGLPAPVVRQHSSTYGPVVPFSGNGGSGNLVNCVDPSETTSCASSLAIGDLVVAFAGGASSQGLAPGAYYVAGTQVITVGYNLASNIPIFQYFIGPNSTYRDFTLDTPVSIYEVGCEMTRAGVSSSDGLFYYESYCSDDPVSFGSNTAGTTYTTGRVCPSKTDNEAYILEIAYGSSRYNPPATAYICQVTAREGMGTATDSTGGATVIRVSNVDQFKPLSVSDMISTVTAFVAAIKSDNGLEGKEGPLGAYVRVAMSSPNPSVVLGSAIGSTLAAAASYGYVAMASLANSSMVDSGSNPFSNTIDNLPMRWRFDGYGWTHSPRALGWSIICIVIASAWFITVFYMFGGGTRYDPTDWYQTINTSAGSNLTQLPGTCTGAGLEAKKVNNCRLWYGELGPGHVGFAHQRTSELQRNVKYGDPNCLA